MPFNNPKLNNIDARTEQPRLKNYNKLNLYDDSDNIINEDLYESNNNLHYF